MDQTLMTVCEVNPNDDVRPQRGDIPVSVKIDGRKVAIYDFGSKFWTDSPQDIEAIRKLLAFHTKELDLYRFSRSGFGAGYALVKTIHVTHYILTRRSKGLRIIDARLRVSRTAVKAA